MVLSIKLKEFYDYVFFQHHAAPPPDMLWLDRPVI